MDFNGFTYQRLNVLKKDINHPKTGIPNDYGIYKWVYWPKFNVKTISQIDLINLLKTYTTCNFYIEEELKGYFKFHAKIWEQGYKDNNNIFGLSNKSTLELESFLTVRANLPFFSDFFKEICFARPFYLGKANDLNVRLSNHIAGKSNVMPSIAAKGISESDIWIGYKIIPNSNLTPKLNTIFEEIYTRKVKPGLSIKPN